MPSLAKRPPICDRIRLQFKKRDVLFFKLAMEVRQAETDWEYMCRGQQEEISKLKQQISQLESLLQDSDDEDESQSNDENRAANLPTHNTPSHQQHRHEMRSVDVASVYKWKERIKVERHMIEKAKDLVERQKRELRSQTQQLKAEKEAWRQEQMTGQSSVILKEMKRILDNNTHTLNQSIRNLRTTDSRLQNRMDKINEMEDVVVLMQSGQSPPPSSSDFSNASNLSSSFESEEGSSLMSLDDSIFDALNKLHDDLQADECHLPPDFDSLHAGDESFAYYGVTPRTHPSLAFGSPRRNPREWAHLRSHAQQFPALGNISVAQQRDLHCASIYEKQISKWVYGRRRVQQAAKQHAKWLTSLCDELHEYSKECATASSSATDAAIRPSFEDDD
ncbi:Aste57867_20944 [Aphanomyces stellatus]|uniref:Aste57867_20944 protein n=1 Tax=Aphanomyces stellatus TaxID=120398 RepID=A0A485LGV4_9STRA|nr:hypothetical protein As57867_020876 [Aphanomyces stellatus]VFT97620.1 Aste57867_20944 [Aphanomyces stellatus]